MKNFVSRILLSLILGTTVSVTLAQNGIESDVIAKPGSLVELDSPRIIEIQPAAASNIGIQLRIKSEVRSLSVQVLNKTGLEILGADTVSNLVPNQHGLVAIPLTVRSGSEGKHYLKLLATLTLSTGETKSAYLSTVVYSGSKKSFDAKVSKTKTQKIYKDLPAETSE